LISDNFSQIHIVDFGSRRIIDTKTITDPNNLIAQKLPLSQVFNNKASIKNLCFSPNESYLGVCLFNGSCLIINPQTFEIAINLTNQDHAIEKTDLSSEFPKIILTSDIVQLKQAYQKKLFDATEKLKISVNSRVPAGQALRKNFDNQFIAICQSDNFTIKIFRLHRNNTSSGLTILNTTNLTVNHKIIDIIVHPTYQYLFLCQENNDISVFSTEDGQLVLSKNLQLGNISSSEQNLYTKNRTLSLDPSGGYILFSKINCDSLQKANIFNRDKGPMGNREEGFKF
jgi:hypothetical protein